MGHGHVIPNPDGSKARCGGPRYCSVCAKELAGRPPAIATVVVSDVHFDDPEGNPAGGTTFGPGFAIGWQRGPLGRGADRREPNGAFVEHVIMAALGRLRYYQTGRFACESNARAIGHLEAAIAELQARAADRESRRVEGTHES